MSDRQLLEDAARAAGIAFVAMDNWPHQDGCRFWQDGETCDCGAAWNPLTDDGDALRLAVKLGIHITNSATDAWASTLLVTAIEPLGNDPCADTRRAIVRAAADLGKGKE